MRALALAVAVACLVGGSAGAQKTRPPIRGPQPAAAERMTVEVAATLTRGLPGDRIGGEKAAGAIAANLTTCVRDRLRGEKLRERRHAAGAPSMLGGGAAKVPTSAFVVKLEWMVPGELAASTLWSFDPRVDACVGKAAFEGVDLARPKGEAVAYLAFDLVAPTVAMISMGTGGDWWKLKDAEKLAPQARLTLELPKPEDIREKVSFGRLRMLSQELAACFSAKGLKKRRPMRLRIELGRGYQPRAIQTVGARLPKKLTACLSAGADGAVPALSKPNRVTVKAVYTPPAPPVRLR